jgi:hypothetical protein
MEVEGADARQQRKSCRSTVLNEENSDNIFSQGNIVREIMKRRQERENAIAEVVKGFSA